MRPKSSHLKALIWVPVVLSSGAGWAQSSVTLYGFLDEGLNFTSNVHGNSALTLSSGNIAGSRFGIKGSEDVGSGYRVIFQLENGFDLNSGMLAQRSRMFGRQAFVGVQSDRYGQITFGRQYDPSVDALGAASLTGTLKWAGDIATHPFDNDNADWSFRVNNAVKYVTPSYRGLTAEAMYAFANEAEGFARNRLWGATLNYHAGNVTAAVSYLKMNMPGASTSGAISTGELFAGASQQNIVTSFNYRFTNVAVGAVWSHVEVSEPTSNVWVENSKLPSGRSWDSWKFNNVEINAQYYFTARFWLSAAYTFTIAHLSAGNESYVPKWHQLGLMLDYDISKRTSIYAQAAFQHVVSAHTGTSFDNARIVDASSGPASGVNQAVYRLGIMHTF
ncbi:porin [Caballeronia peredens]|nr:porin [Caballeronia peredens]